MLSNGWLIGLSTTLLGAIVVTGVAHRRTIVVLARQWIKRCLRAWNAFHTNLPVHNVRTPPITQPDAFMWWTQSAGGFISSQPVPGVRIEYLAESGYFRIYDQQDEVVQTGGGDGMIALRDNQIVSVMLKGPQGLVPIWPLDDFDWLLDEGVRLSSDKEGE